MANRKQRRQGTARAQPSPKPPAGISTPVINVWARDGLFVQQVSMGPGYVAEIRLPLELAEGFVDECKGVLTELRTGLKVENKSSSLIVP